MRDTLGEIEPLGDLVRLAQAIPVATLGAPGAPRLATVPARARLAAREALVRVPQACQDLVAGLARYGD